MCMYFIGAKCLSGAAGALRGGGARAALGAALAGGGAGATLALTRAGARAALGASLARAGARAALARAGAALGATLARAGAGGSLGSALARAGAALGAALAGGGAGGASEFTAPVGGVFLHLLGIDEFAASATRAGARAALGASLALTRAGAGGSLGATLARAGGSLGATLAGGGAGGARATELTAPEGRVLLHLLCWNEGGVWYPEEVMRYVCEIRGIQERSRNNEKVRMCGRLRWLGCCSDTSGNAIKEQLVDAGKKRRYDSCFDLHS